MYFRFSQYLSTTTIQSYTLDNSHSISHLPRLLIALRSSIYISWKHKARIQARRATKTFSTFMNCWLFFRLTWQKTCVSEKNHFYNSEKERLRIRGFPLPYTYHSRCPEYFNQEEELTIYGNAWHLNPHNPALKCQLTRVHENSQEAMKWRFLEWHQLLGLNSIEGKSPTWRFERAGLSCATRFITFTC